MVSRVREWRRTKCSATPHRPNFLRWCPHVYTSAVVRSNFCGSVRFNERTIGWRYWCPRIVDATDHHDPVIRVGASPQIAIKRVKACITVLVSRLLNNKHAGIMVRVTRVGYCKRIHFISQCAPVAKHVRGLCGCKAIIK